MVAGTAVIGRLRMTARGAPFRTALADSKNVIRCLSAPSYRSRCLHKYQGGPSTLIFWTKSISSLRSSDFTASNHHNPNGVLLHCAN